MMFRVRVLNRVFNRQISKNEGHKKGQVLSRDLVKIVDSAKRQFPLPQKEKKMF